ncbi:MAG TPA: adenylate cyclase [Candidatus Limnocylindria bacterium]|nr:adenylate cyclase [Candidatus Limnocylindria bacterium]
MPRQPTPARLTDDQLRDLLRLSRGSDSVELKLTVPAEGHRSAIRSLGIDALDAQIRQVFFFDTPDLKLYASGLNLRARRIQGKGEDSVVKLRPVEPDQLEEEWRVSPNMKVEVDAMPGGYVSSASMKGRPATGDTRKAALGGLPIRKLFSKEQRTFYDLHAPAGVQIDDLSVLGPIFVLKVTFTPEDFDRRLVAEMWFYPDGRRLLELSTKCAPDELMQVATVTRLFLSDHGIDLTSAQETKTKNALQFYAKELQQAPASTGVTNGAAADGDASVAPKAEELPAEVAAATADGAPDPTGAPTDGATEGDPD